MARKHSKTLACAARFPFYLWIAGLYPILHLYHQNFGLVRDNEVAHAIIGMIIGTTLVYMITKPLQKNPHKRAFYLCIASLTFSTSGHLYSLFVMPNSLLAWNIASAIVVTAIAIACARFIPQRSYTHFTTPFNLIAGALLTMQIIILLGAWTSSQRYVDANSAYYQTRDQRPSAKKVMDSPARPDIYYIVPDGYPSDEWHLTKMNVDNSEFTKALRERGFVIAPHAQSNYGTTLHSLAATLNMSYYATNPSDFSDLDYLQNEVADNEVARLLLDRGYTYLQLMSGFLLPSPIADENLEFGINGAIKVLPGEGLLSPQRVLWGSHNETQVLDMLKIDENVQIPFAPFYFETTLLRIALPLLEDLRLASGSTPFGLYAPRRFLATLEELERIAQRPEATFTIAHLIKPHGPLTFDENGNTVEPTWHPSAEAYAAELTFVNRMYLNTLDSILSASDGQALIIFQADHATILGDPWTEDVRKTLFDVYAAYHLPERFEIELPRPYTMVNSFALILNEVFDMGLDWQEDRLWDIWKGYDAPFEQVDVTEEYLQR